MENPFEIAVLASGSRGNATYVNVGNKRFLIDLGLRVTDLQRHLMQIDVDANDLDAVFITHEHDDHIKGLELFVKKFDVPVYTSERTWRAIVNAYPLLERKNCYLFNKEKVFDNIRIINFAVSHDAVDAHGYSIMAGDAKMTYATDLGFVTPDVQVAIENCTTLVIESNHDVEMLKNGPYSFRLKRRILSTLGHLANNTTAETVAKLKVLPQEIFLAHLSQHNNTRELALKTIKERLHQVGRSTKILVAEQNKVVTNFSYKEEELWKNL